MSRTSLQRASLLVALAHFGCDKAPEAEPGDASPIVRDVPADNGNTPADVPNDAENTPDVADDASVDAPGPADASDGGALADAAPPGDASCVSDGGCWACAPRTSDEFISRCTPSACVRFDNRARLPRLLPDGGLPPLP